MQECCYGDNFDSAQIYLKYIDFGNNMFLKKSWGWDLGQAREMTRT